MEKKHTLSILLTWPYTFSDLGGHQNIVKQNKQEGEREETFQCHICLGHNKVYKAVAATALLLSLVDYGLNCRDSLFQRH